MRARALPWACWVLLLGCGARPPEPLGTPPPDLRAPSEPPAKMVQPRTEATSEPAAATPATQAVSARPPPAPPPAPPPDVEVGEPEFVGAGTVAGVEAFLDKTRANVARCVADNGGLSADEGEMKVQFLVSLREKADGVEVLSSKGVSDEANRCVRKYVTHRRVGTPTADPVGVQFRYRFARPAPP